MLVLFLRFPRVSEVYLEKLTVLNSVPPFSSLKPNKKAIPAYPERVLKGFLAYFQLICNVWGQRGRAPKVPTSCDDVVMSYTTTPPTPL